jgi:hypothetical protein
MLDAYASSTGNLKNLEVLKKLKWGLVVAPFNERMYDFKSYFIDNGAWSCYTQKENWKKRFEFRFKLLCDCYGEKADFIIAPDIVGGGNKSLDFSLSYLEELSIYGTKILLPVQDGVTNRDFYNLLSPKVGLFLGGTTEWKLKSITKWAWIAQRYNCHFHVARVNTCRRIKLCGIARAHSFDGSYLSRYIRDAEIINNCRLKVIYENSD